MIGLVAVAGLAPKALAKLPAVTAGAPASPAAFSLRPEARAVARRADAV